MDDLNKYCNISDEDIRAALNRMKTYIDVTEEDLRKIYELAVIHARERLAAKIPVIDVMTREVITVNKDDDFHKAAGLLSEHNISGMPVVDEDGIVIGIVSEADILSAAGMKKGRTLKDILRHIFGEPLPERTGGHKVRDIMTSPAITTAADEDIKEVARIFDEKRIKRLPVVDDENRLLGIVSRADLIRALSK
ncbi:MAG: CBS domain-containing protein [Nitrospirae bacterium]|nr:CBS domain-containing protein [Nitrospirota bacterium]